jgi:hypothetical protein
VVRYLVSHQTAALGGAALGGRCRRTHTHLEGRANQQRWAPDVNQVHPIRHPRAHLDLLLPVRMGDRSDRSATSSVHVERRRNYKCRVAWRIACSPKEYGGLGIRDLRIMGSVARTPHTAPVLCEYVLLWEILEGVHLQPFEPDRFVW